MTELRQLREAADLTRLELAQMAKVSAYRLQMAEYGHGELTPEEWERVLPALRPGVAKTIRAVARYQQLAGVEL